MKKPFGLHTLIWLIKGIFVRFPRVQYDGSQRQNRNTSKLYITLISLVYVDDTVYGGQCKR